MLKATFKEMNSDLEMVYSVDAYPNMSKLEVVQRLILLPLVTTYRSEYFSMPGISVEDCTVYLN
tara:strand:+ start:243 stop:434 length:192 start_codon:yes stop_codon:yes gene_type:complete